MAAAPTDQTKTTTTSTTTTNPPIPSCTLDHAAGISQAARYRTLSSAVSRIHRSADTLTVQFDEHLDRVLLEQTLAVERQCCGFFVFRLDNDERRLMIGVRDAAQAPALDVLATAFTGA
jgi:hypothetical protein